jgi:hypothetical protein
MYITQYIQEQENLLHVSAPGCPRQGNIHNKWLQAQRTNLGIVSPLLKQLKY